MNKTTKFAYDIKKEHAIIIKARNAKMLRLYETGQYNLRMLAEQFGIHHSTVANAIAKARRERANQAT